MLYLEKKWLFWQLFNSLPFSLLEWMLERKKYVYFSSWLWVFLFTKRYLQQQIYTVLASSLNFQIWMFKHKQRMPIRKKIFQCCIPWSVLTLRHLNRPRKVCNWHDIYYWEVLGSVMYQNVNRFKTYVTNFLS